MAALTPKVTASMTPTSIRSARRCVSADSSRGALTPSR